MVGVVRWSLRSGSFAVLEWALVLPLAMPAYIIAYTYTGMLDVTGPVQGFIRDTFDLRFGDYWFPQIRSLGGAYDVAKIELLAELIQLNATTSVNYSSYARAIRASVESIQRWIILLQQLSYCFTLRPWTKNISRSIAKEPKVYLGDWSGIADVGKRNENFIACSLLKAVEGWNDTGLGNYALHFIRTKEKREVDFVITADGSPWLLVEVKTSETTLSPQLEYFQKMIGAPHALQAVINLPYQEIDCFSLEAPTVVPAQTLLSQLL